MKIDKQMQKNCTALIKEIAVNNGYKKIQSSIYKLVDDNIIFADFLIVNSSKLSYRLYIKKMTFDDIFWKIMRMEENIKRSVSLRVIGAFSAPSVLISKGDIELSEEIDMIANTFIERISGEVDDFLKNKDVIQCILPTAQKYDGNILQCLVYIELGVLDKAKELAKQEILAGDKGRFVNEGKGFFEWVLLYDN